MSDNNIAESERRLQEIGNQLGTPILSPTTKIQVDDQSVPSSQSNADIEGTLDSQPSSKNPLLQYIVAGAIGLGAVGIPLTVLFGLGGTPTATKPTAPEVEDTTSSLADRELDNLKTQSALDIQAKGETQTVAQTPKPVATPAPAPAPTVAAPKPKPQPVVKANTPKPRTIAVQRPTVVAATPAPIARPVPIPVARPMPRPTPVPVVQQPRPTPIPVATQPTQPTQPVTPVTPEQPPLSFEQASALGMFGGDNDKSDNGATLAAADNSALTLSLPVGANVAAHTVTPYTSLSSRNSATNGTETPLSVQLDQPIQLSQGFNLPAGTIVQFGATVADNGAVTATSKGVFIDGTEIKVPVGAFALTASNSAALVANQRSLREGELSGADTTAAMWGAAGSLGKALVDSGNTSVVNTSGLGTSVVQTNSGNVNIPGALLNGAFSPLAKAKEARANTLATELQQSSKLNEIPVRSLVRVFVAAAATVQVPVTSDATSATGMPQRGQSVDGGDVEQPPTMIPTKPISAVNVQPVVAPTSTTATIQPVTAIPTSQPTQGINTPSPIAPTKPNNVANTQPAIVVPTPVTTSTQPLRSIPSTPTQLIPTQTPTVTTSQPIVTAPSPTQLPAATTQSVVTQQQSTATTQPIIAPSQPTSTTTKTSPLAPTKPNNIVNTQPQSNAPSQATGNNTTPAFIPIPANSGIDAQSPPIVTSTQLIEAQNTQDPAQTATQPTTGGTPSGLKPIQFDNGGSIQPVTTPNPAMAPLP
jgi:outer membrane biosynthesis protein TonB